MPNPEATRSRSLAKKQKSSRRLFFGLTLACVCVCVILSARRKLLARLSPAFSRMATRMNSARVPGAAPDRGAHRQTVQPRQRALDCALKVSPRHGITIVELLVALAIIGMLCALVVPAVLAARETSRRAGCTSNLRQIGIAISQYESVHGMFPPGGSKGMSFHVALLPFTEQSALFQKVNYRDVDQDGIADHEEIRGIVIPLYRCPSESAASTIVAGGLVAFTSYAGNFGTGVLRDGYNGMFRHMMASFPGRFPEGPIRAQDVRDGLSNTVAVAEILHFGDSNQRLRRNWNTPTAFWGPSGVEALAKFCDHLPADPLAAGFRGDFFRGEWTCGDPTRTLYNHVLTPNRPSCHNGTHVQEAVSTAASPHSAGVHALYADGHVTYVANSIGRDVWRDLGSRCSSNCGLVLD